MADFGRRSPGRPTNRFGRSISGEGNAPRVGRSPPSSQPLQRGSLGTLPRPRPLPATTSKREHGLVGVGEAPLAVGESEPRIVYGHTEA